MKYKQYSDEELDIMEKYTVPLTERKLDGIVFGYADFNAGDAEFGVDYGGFSIVLFDNGIVEVREYLFSEILVEERCYSVPQSCISEIQQEYQKYYHDIQTAYAPDNGSCDGSISYFYFGNGWIDALNIEYHDKKTIERIHEVHSDDFDEWMPIIQEENKIMKIFFSICEILKRYDVILNEYSVTVHGESTTTYSEFYSDDSYFQKFLIWCKKLFEKLKYNIMNFLR